MSLNSHVLELRRKHEALDRQIELEQARPGSDDLIIARMKREKLHIKDEIQKLSAH